MTYSEQQLLAELEEWNHLHVWDDDGVKWELHLHDTTITSGHVRIDSKLGDWSFPIDHIVRVEMPHSHPEGLE